MGQFYGTSIWDPVLILAQIVSVQCLFYLSLCTALYLFLGTSTGGALTVEVLFDYRKLVGAFSFAAFLTSALAGSLILYFVVENRLRPGRRLNQHDRQPRHQRRRSDLEVLGLDQDPGSKLLAGRVNWELENLAVCEMSGGQRQQALLDDRGGESFRIT